MPHGELAQLLRDRLGIDTPPVAVAFVDAVPAGVEPVGSEVPAGCRFWLLARERVFVTDMADHAGCGIGVMTMGFEPSPEIGQQVGELVAEMESIGYLAPGEAGSLPTMPAGTKHVVYGPLAEFPVDPDAVLVTSTAEQAMVLHEATGGVELSGSGVAIHGRPACSAIPRALASGRPAMSLGCAGMRTFTGIEPGMLVTVVPRADLDALPAGIERVAAANEHMRAA
jgi:uncharacterized protein (DUF169 family)